MRTITFKGLFLTVLFVLLGSLSIQAVDDGLITKQITIKLDKAGTLADKIGKNKKYKITNLKIVGEINGSDLKFVRDMAGGSFRDEGIVGKLSVLDLSEAKIIKGGSFYYSPNGSYDEYYTTDDAIGSYAFYECCELKSLKLPSGVTEIGSFAFKYCSRLTSLTLPSGVTEIGVAAFYCSGLTSLIIPPGVTEIGDLVFKDCTDLTSLSLPSGVTEIGSSAFEGCRGLSSLTIPPGVTKIGYYAFKGCSRLTSLTIHSDVTEIGYYAFGGCTGLKDVSFYINGDFETYLTKNHPHIDVNCGIEYCLNGKKITSVVIPSTITALGEYVFQNCRDLTSVTVSWQSPISAGSAFYGVDRSKCTLYVPQGTEQDYWLADVWGDFGKIVEYAPTGIDKVTTSTDAKELSRYSVNGQRLSAPAKGLNIVKYSDGSVKKIAVQ